MLSNTNNHTGKKIQNYIFNYSDFLGSGNFSKCYKATNIVNNEVVAIKIIQLNSLTSKKLQQLLYSQIQILKQLNHPNVLRCFQVFTSNRNCYIITQLCNDGDIETKLKKNNHQIKQKQIQKIILDVFQGLKYLTSKGIVHRDLKISNIFMKNGVSKIADFGFAVNCRGNFKDLNIGSPLYMAPQGVLYNTYGLKTDVWSFGIMVYQLYHNKTPFGYCLTEEQLRNAIIKPLQWSQFKIDMPLQVKQFILKCLQIREDKRPTFLQLENTPFIMGLKSKPLLQNDIQNIRSPFSTHTILSNNQNNIQRISNRLDIPHFAQARNNSVHDRRQRVISSSRNNLSNNSRFNNITQSVNLRQNKYGSPSSQFFRPHIINNFNTFHQQISKNHQNQISITSIISPTSINKITPNVNQSIKSPLILQPNRQKQAKLLLNCQINFKQSVSILHYCRLLFKYLQLSKDSLRYLNNQQQYGLLGSYLIRFLCQLNQNLEQKKINFQGQNRQARQMKLKQVVDEYLKKYKTQLSQQTLRQFMPKHQVSVSTIRKYLEQKCLNYKLQSNSTRQQIILAEFLLILFTGTSLLLNCIFKNNFDSFQRNKQIQQILGTQKETFCFQAYTAHKSKVFPQNIIVTR